MSDLTREYLDKKLNRLATKDDLDGLATKEDLNTLEGNLKLYTEQEVAELAGMVSRRFDKLEKKLDLREEVDQLKAQMKKVWDALNIKN